MRGKTARRLRRFARSLVSKGTLDVVYNQLRPTWVYDTPVPLPISKKALFTGQVEMITNCTRYVYQDAKKRFKKAPHTERVFPGKNK